MFKQNPNESNRKNTSHRLLAAIIQKCEWQGRGWTNTRDVKKTKLEWVGVGWKSFSGINADRNQKSVFQEIQKM